MQIGPHGLKNILVLAPMAGVTDRPFRQLCRKLGAGIAVPEIVTSNPGLFYTRKTQPRLSHYPEPAFRLMRIAGADPKQLAVAAIRIARKHIGWYLEQKPGGKAAISRINQLYDATDQLNLISDYFSTTQELAA